MTTQICSKCNTRNQAGAEQCRRCNAPLAVAESRSSVGETVVGNPTSAMVGGRWRIERPVDVQDAPFLFVARDVETDEPVEIRRPDPTTARDRTERSRVLREARILASLDHPHVARVVEVVEESDRISVVMEYFEGPTLAELLASRGRLPVGVSLYFMTQMLAGLNHIHANDVVLGRLDPFVVRIRRPGAGEAPALVLTRFGAARRAASSARATPSTLVGMSHRDASEEVDATVYTAPELLDGRGDRRSDLYATAAIFYEMLAGRPIFEGLSDDSLDLVDAIHKRQPEELRSARPEISAELSELVGRLLARDPDARPGSAGEVLEALRETPEALLERMIAVPTGAFLRGSLPDDETARPEEQPVRAVELDAFFIDQTPVTVAQFHRYLEETGAPISRGWARYNDVEHHPHLPVVYVDYDEARGYAEWAGKSLPTEAQWEKAARSDDGRTYPWGDGAPTPQLACYGDRRDRPDSVFAHPDGASPYGVLDMSGNAFEWVADWFSRDAYEREPERNPTGPDGGTKRVLKGGSFVHGAFALRCATRGRYVPDQRRANHSFRCAWMLEA